jgi:hypothetical protein
MDIDRKREAEWPHWPDRGSPPAPHDRLERRLFHDSELEAELARTQETVRQLELAAAAKAVEVEELEHAVARTNGTHATEAVTHLVFVWTPHGYSLDVADGPAPEAGARVSVDGVERVVAKLGRSPLPGDERRCAYLEP